MDIYEKIAFSALGFWILSGVLLAITQFSRFGILGEKGSLFKPLPKTQRYFVIVAGVSFVLGAILLFISFPKIV